MFREGVYARFASGYVRSVIIMKIVVLSRLLLLRVSYCDETKLLQATRAAWLEPSTPSFGTESLAPLSLALPRKPFPGVSHSGRFSPFGAVSSVLANEAQRLFCGHQAGAS